VLRRDRRGHARQLAYDLSSHGDQPLGDTSDN
jgi:hypothetical protein